MKNNHLGEGNPELANGRYYNIIEAMHKSFNYDIGEEMRQYIKEGPNSVKRVTGKDDARCFQLVNWQINAVFSQYGRPVNAMIFDAIVGCKLAVCTSIEGVEMYDEVTEADFDLRFVLDMTCPGGRIWPPRIVPAKDAFRGMALCQGIPMNEYFEPVLRTNEDYDRFARMMLSVYNERALTRPTIIRGTDLATDIAIYFKRTDGSKSRVYSYADILNRLGIKVITQTDVATAEAQLRMAKKAHGKPGLFSKGKIRDCSEEIEHLTELLHRYQTDEFVRDWE